MLKGKSIILRPLKLSDWEKTLEWRNNIGIKQMAMMHPFPVTEMVEKEWYENIMKSSDNKTIYFTITIMDNKPIGFLTLSKINQTNRNCYFGIVIGEPESHGKGFGTEATILAIDYAFNKLNMNKITLEVIETNTFALKLYHKLGFIEEGRLKQHYYNDNKYFDVIILSIFKNS